MVRWKLGIPVQSFLPAPSVRPVLRTPHETHPSLTKTTYFEVSRPLK